MVAILLASLALGNSWHMHYTKPFSMNGSRYVVAAGRYGHFEGTSGFGGDSPGDSRIDLIEVPRGRAKKLVNSTKINDGIMVLGAAIHLAPVSPDGAQGTARATARRIPLLAIAMTGGQWGFALIYRFDAVTLRPCFIQDFIEGVDSALGRGLVYEASPAHYLEPGELPKGVSPRNQWVERTWRLSPKDLTFTAGKWRLAPPSRQ